MGKKIVIDVPYAKAEATDVGTKVTVCYGETRKKGDFEFEKPYLCVSKQFDRILGRKKLKKIQRSMFKNVKRQIRQQT